MARRHDLALSRRFGHFCHPRSRCLAAWPLPLETVDREEMTSCYITRSVLTSRIANIVCSKLQRECTGGGSDVQSTQRSTCWDRTLDVHADRIGSRPGKK